MKISIKRRFYIIQKSAKDLLKISIKFDIFSLKVELVAKRNNYIFFNSTTNVFEKVGIIIVENKLCNLLLKELLQIYSIS